ncbi:hypothetical protein KPH14_012393 [Odynerus spinipes]|uniref:Uncharacterized protein n=1 Tax=Odynerus spinipes TaxID=1348599 RepID=A0AAD9VNA5_9HYME|nr:hypothetical protein KPH14_012393 [Odynerus spinipes]
MSERKVELIENVEKQNPGESLAVEDDDIIDVSAFDFSDTDRWLYEPVQYSPETMVHDLYAWLRNSPETSYQNSHTATKKSIDTRTFTRPKKRNSRMSFESIIEALPPQLQNVCKIKDKESHKLYQNASKKQMSEKKEFIPFMLKATMGVNSFVPDDALVASGRESMEAFLNMSSSKGIDSFINLVEPEFGDTLMNISHPSILYSSIISLASSELDNTITENKNEDKISINNTFTSKSTSKKMNLNDTYDTDMHNDVSSNAKIEQACIEVLSSTFTNPSDLNVTIVKSQSTEASNSLDTTYHCTNAKEGKKQTMDKPMFDLKVEKNEKQCPNNMALPVQNNCANLVPHVTVFGNKQPSKHENLLNETFKSINKNSNPCQSFMNSTCLPAEEIPSLRRELLTEIQRSGRYKLHSVYSNASDEPFAQLKAKENIDVTYDSSLIQKSIIPIENKYNTYRKLPSEDQRNSQNELPNCNIVTCTQKDLQSRKFYTFTKKTGNINGKNSLETVEQFSNIDTTFCKPAPKSPKKKLHAPKTLSKLPQILQKSNPNLLLNTTKTIDITGYSHIPNVGQVRGSYINAMQNIAKPITNKSCSLGKLRSGSEQRLPHVDINATFQKPSSAGSTESIDSTQSVHSAPDLDDRLSVCSDSSRNSYNVRTTNMEQLHQIVCAQEECSKHESTPKPKKQILHNNWIDELKDLPSPISKNNIEEPKSNLSSLTSMDSTLTASSPIISPTGSSQAINSQPINEEHKVSSNVEEKEQGNVAGFVKTATNKPPNVTENKTRLRQPTNWNTGNKPPGIVSGIPRPPSRIPAFRFVRPNTKPNQGDLKKGCL